MSTYCIVLDAHTEGDAAHTVAAGDLRRAMARIDYAEVARDRAEVTIEVRSIEGPGDEGFEIEPLPSTLGLRVSGTPAGAAYGLLHLAKRLVIDGPDWQMRTSSSPALAERMYSETGQLLCLPDWGFWSEQPQKDAGRRSGGGRQFHTRRRRRSSRRREVTLRNGRENNSTRRNRQGAFAPLGAHTVSESRRIVRASIAGCSI